MVGSLPWRSSRFTSSDVLPVTVVIDREGNVREVIEGILLPEEIDEKIKPLLSESIPLGPQSSPPARVRKNQLHFLQWLTAMFLVLLDVGRRGRLRSQDDGL